MIDFDNVANLIFDQPKMPDVKVEKSTEDTQTKPVKKGKRTIDLGRIEDRLLSDRTKD